MALHPNFPESPYAILDPAIRWFTECRRKAPGFSHGEVQRVRVP